MLTKSHIAKIVDILNEGWGIEIHNVVTNTFSGVQKMNFVTDNAFFEMVSGALISTDDVHSSHVHATQPLFSEQDDDVKNHLLNLIDEAERGASEAAASGDKELMHSLENEHENLLDQLDEFNSRDPNHPEI